MVLLPLEQLKPLLTNKSVILKLKIVVVYVSSWNTVAELHKCSISV